jgi:hypothetical protein
MSSLGVTSGAGAGAGDGPGGREHDRPLGGLAATPPVPRKHGRLQGSRNKKTLATLAAAATTGPIGAFGTGRSSTIVAAPGGTVAAAASGAVVPTATTSVASLSGTPLEAAAALIGAAMAFGAAPLGLAGLSVDGSSGAATKKA